MCSDFDLRKRRPVFPGDTLRIEVEGTEKTPSRSRPEMGSYKMLITVLNQDDAAVMTMYSIGLIGRRSVAGTARAVRAVVEPGGAGDASLPAPNG